MSESAAPSGGFGAPFSGTHGPESAPPCLYSERSVVNFNSNFEQLTLMAHGFGRLRGLSLIALVDDHKHHAEEESSCSDSPEPRCRYLSAQSVRHGTSERPGTFGNAVLTAHQVRNPSAGFRAPETPFVPGRVPLTDAARKPPFVGTCIFGGPAAGLRPPFFRKTVAKTIPS